jgi:hypothetical protein
MQCLTAMSIMANVKVAFVMLNVCHAVMMHHHRVNSTYVGSGRVGGSSLTPVYTYGRT